MQEEWAKIQLILGKQLPSGQLKAWVSTLVPVQEEGSLVLCAQTEFAASHVRAWYGHLLEQAARAVYGPECSLRIECRAGIRAHQAQNSPIKNRQERKNSVGSPIQSALAQNSQERKKLAGGTAQALAQSGLVQRYPVPKAPAQVGPQGLSSAREKRAGKDRPSEEGAGHDDLAASLVSSSYLQQFRSPHSPVPASEAGEAEQGGCAELLMPPSPVQAGSPRPLALQSPQPASPAPRPLAAVHLGLPLFDGSEERSAAATRSPVWRYSFEDFVVGPSNELAHAASRSICNDAMPLDILFLSSAPGLGKTHLMHAVGKTLYSACNRKQPHVECLTAEEFASRFYLSLKSQDTDRFKARYRTADLLLLEDVHFLQGKEKMQAELLATIKALQERGSKLVFSSSFAPRDLKCLDDQLQSRFSSGLVTGIERPDEDTRRRILRTKASLHQVALPGDVEDVLARHIHTDVRRIESCLHNLILKAKLCNSRITLQMAWEVVGQYAAHSPVLDLEAIITYVCQGFGLSREQLHSSSRKQENVRARNAAFFLARKHTDLSLESIGRQFNRRHSTVLKGITSLEREISRKSPQGRQIANILDMIERNGNVVTGL